MSPIGWLVGHCSSLERERRRRGKRERERERGSKKKPDAKRAKTQQQQKTATATPATATKGTATAARSTSGTRTPGASTGVRGKEREMREEEEFLLLSLRLTPFLSRKTKTKNINRQLQPWGLQSGLEPGGQLPLRQREQPLSVLEGRKRSFFFLDLPPLPLVLDLTPPPCSVLVRFASEFSFRTLCLCKYRHLYLFVLCIFELGWLFGGTRARRRRGGRRRGEKKKFDDSAHFSRSPSMLSLSFFAASHSRRPSVQAPFITFQRLTLLSALLLWQ